MAEQGPRRRTYKLPTEERLMRSAIAYLDRYASSTENLRRVLGRKVLRAANALDRNADEFSPLIDIVVDRCQRSGLVDDKAYAETKLVSLRRRGRSQRQIQAALTAKGVDRTVIERTLEQDPADDESAARTLARRRRLGPWRTRGPREDFRDKDMAALCRAGFSFDIARRVIESERPDAD